MMMVCPRCGKPGIGQERFCRGCGAELQAVNPRPSPQEPGWMQYPQRSDSQPDGQIPAQQFPRKPEPEIQGRNNQRKPSKGPWVWIIICLILVILLVAATVLFIYPGWLNSRGNMPSGSGKTADGETASGEIVLYHSDPDQVITDPETQIRYIGNEILVTAKSGTSREDVERFVSVIGGKVVGWNTYLREYQVLLPSAASMAEMDIIQREFMHSDLFDSASVNYDTDTSEDTEKPYPNDSERQYGDVYTESLTERPDETPVVTDSPDEPENGDVRVGRFVAYGRYEQDNNLQNGAEPIEWIVLDVRDGKALLLSRYALDNKPYHTEEMTYASWKNCSLRTRLNSDFMNTAFSGDEQKSILLTGVNNSDSLEYEDHDYNEDGTGGFAYTAVSGENTQDYVFLLSCYETDLYAALLPACRPTLYAAANGLAEWGDPEPRWCDWWLRTAGTDGSAGFMMDDFISFFRAHSDDGVRPAMWIDLTNVRLKVISDDSVPQETKLDPAPFRTVGNIVTFGRYEQDDDEGNGSEPVEWIVLDVKDGKALLLSRYGLDCKPYNDFRENVTWETCSLRRWLNATFMKEAFNKAERSAILNTEVDNSIEQGIDYEGVIGSNDTQDWVFLLSNHETNVYFADREARACAPTEYAFKWDAIRDDDGWTRWWLRSVGGFECSAVYQSYNIGRESDYVDYDRVAVRPAVWVDLEADIFR